MVSFFTQRRVRLGASEVRSKAIEITWINSTHLTGWTATYLPLFQIAKNWWMNHDKSPFLRPKYEMVGCLPMIKAHDSWFKKKLGTFKRNCHGSRQPGSSCARSTVSTSKMLLSSTSSDDAGKMWEVHGDRCPCFPGAHRDHWKNAQSCLDGIHRRKKIRLVTMFHQYLRDLSKKCVKMLVHQLAKHQAYDSYDGLASSSPWCLDQIKSQEIRIKHQVAPSLISLPWKRKLHHLQRLFYWNNPLFRSQRVTWNWPSGNP